MTFDDFCGFCPYEDHFPGDQRNPRIVIPIRVRSFSFHAIVDTGAPWNILDPEVVDSICPRIPRSVDTSLHILGERWSGPLTRFDIILPSTGGGKDLAIQGTFFVPMMIDGVAETYRGPNFLGLLGALERMRFAVDPMSQTFHFGAIE